LIFETLKDMKRLIYVLPLLLTLAAGCIDNGNNTPAPDPSGTFTGEFRRIHRNTDLSIDTTKATIKVIIEPGVGYHVLGDTATLHAGSKGHYGISGNGIMFVDNTLPAPVSGAPTPPAPKKVHLNGEYLFVYNGSIFQMVKVVGDTLSLQYDLKKTN
jgi:hypothetical protein